MTIRKNRLIVLVISLILLFSSALVGCTSEEEFVAKVNDEGITKAEFEENFQIQKMIIERQVGPDIWTKEMSDGRIYEDVIRDKILESLIKEVLILQDAEEVGIEVSQEEIDTEVNKMKEINGGQEQFEEDLEEYGVSLEYIEEIIKRGIIVSKYKEELIANLDITEENLREYFQENKDEFITIRAKHILVETEEEALDIIAELEEGKDFSELAMERSIDPSAASNGGDLNYFSRGEMVPAFEEAAFALEVNEISQPVKSEYGYHVIKVVDKVSEFEDLKEQVRYGYEEQKFNDRVEKLKESAEIEIYTEE